MCRLPLSKRSTRAASRGAALDRRGDPRARCAISCGARVSSRPRSMPRDVAATGDSAERERLRLPPRHWSLVDAAAGNARAVRHAARSGAGGRRASRPTTRERQAVRGAAQRRSPPASRSPARWPAGRARSRELYRGLVAVGAETGRLARRARAARRLSRSAAGAAAEIHAGAHLSGAGDDHRVRGDRGAAGVRRAAGRIGVPAEPADAAVAHAGADRASAISFARTGVDVAVGARSSPTIAFALANRREAFRARWHRRRCCESPVDRRCSSRLDTARFASTLAILVGSGAPLLRSLDAARDVVWALPLRRGRARGAELRARRRVAGARVEGAARVPAACSCISWPTAKRAGSSRRCSSARRASWSAKPSGA